MHIIFLWLGYEVPWTRGCRLFYHQFSCLTCVCFILSLPLYSTCFRKWRSFQNFHVQRTLLDVLWCYACHSTCKSSSNFFNEHYTAFLVSHHLCALRCVTHVFLDIGKRCQAGQAVQWEQVLAFLISNCCGRVGDEWGSGGNALERNLARLFMKPSASWDVEFSQSSILAGWIPSKCWLRVQLETGRLFKSFQFYAEGMCLLFVQEAWFLNNLIPSKKHCLCKALLKRGQPLWSACLCNPVCNGRVYATTMQNKKQSGLRNDWGFLCSLWSRMTKSQLRPHEWKEVYLECTVSQVMSDLFVEHVLKMQSK